MSKPTAPSRKAPVVSVATTGAATLLTLFAASESRGVIITNTAGFTKSFTQDAKVSWDIDNNGVVEAEFEFTSSSLGLKLQSKNEGFGLVTAGGQLKNLTLSPSPENISSKDPFQHRAEILSFGEFDYATGFTSGEKGYIGFRYTSAVTGTPLYGWASVTITEGTSGSFTLHEWAYEDSGASIQVGQTTSAIPEPANVAFGLGALALGAAGLMRWRKRKAA